MQTDGRALVEKAIASASHDLRKARSDRSEAGAEIGDREADQVAAEITRNLSRGFQKIIANRVAQSLAESHHDAVADLEPVLADAMRGRDAEELTRVLAKLDYKYGSAAGKVIRDLEKSLDQFADDWRDLLLSLPKSI
jgi:hypothetical protein